MEDVLDVYTRPYDASRPVVCMDEINTQLLICMNRCRWNRASQSAKTTSTSGEGCVMCFWRANPWWADG